MHVRPLIAPLRRHAIGLAALALLPSFAFAGGIDFFDRKTGSISSDRLTPGREAATRFGANPDWACPSRGIYGVVADQLEMVAKDKQRPVPQTDGRLCAVAEAFLVWDKKTPPDRRLWELVGRYYGLPTAPYHVFVTDVQEDVRGGRSAADDPKALIEKIFEAMVSPAFRGETARYGLATMRVRRGVTRFAFAYWDGNVALDPVARRLAPGEKATLSGKVLGDAENPKLLISEVGGKLLTPPPTPGKEFRAELACGDKAGQIRVEIRGETGGSPVVLARFPIACGAELPTTIPLEAEAWPTETAKQERKVVDLVNAERAQLGLVPVVWDEPLATIARDLSEALRATSTFPDDIAARMKKAGIASSVVVVNPAADMAVESAYEQLANGPAYRANMLNPDVNDVGIGIVASKRPDGTPLVYLTQIFIKELPPLNVEEVRQKLRDAAAQKRKDGRLPPLSSDPLLEEAAQKYAVDLAASQGELTKARKDALTTQLNGAFKTVSVTSGAKSDPLDFAEEPEVTAAGKFLGVGVATGMHPVLGRNGVYAVIIVGTRR
jgi:uncharacterized protein YkwD